jgi:sugar porter (SP) family MFS transporter
MLFLPESPSWYLARGQQMKAVHAFGLLRKDQGWRSHIQEIKNLAASKKEGSWKNFFKPSFRFALMVGILLSVFQQITGINTVIYYAPKIFQMAGYNNASSAIVASLAIGTINSMLTGFSVWILDRGGRKPLLLASVCGMLVSLLCLSIAFFTHSTFIDLIAIISLMAYVGFFAIGMGPVTWVVLSEIYPLQMRGRAMGLAIFVNWLFNYFVSLTFLDLLQTLGVGGAFCFYAVICVIALWFVYRYIPETKGKSLEQIEKKLQSR